MPPESSVENVLDVLGVGAPHLEDIEDAFTCPYEGTAEILYLVDAEEEDND